MESDKSMNEFVTFNIFNMEMTLFHSREKYFYFTFFRGQIIRVKIAI